MNPVFFGDSITEGSNSNCSFVDFIGGKNFGISGTTIGEYSIYPVDGKSLLSLYPVLRARDFDTIYLEYGINDVTAIMCGFSTIDTVTISFIKALDGIRQINDKAKIFFLSLSNDSSIILEYAKRQCAYLKHDYFKDYDFLFPPVVWAGFYTEFIDNVSKKLPVIPMIKDKSFLDNYISSDNLHPDITGHRIIANNVLDYMRYM